MTGEAIKQALEYHNILPKKLLHYNTKVVGLFFKSNRQLNEDIKKFGGICCISLTFFNIPTTASGHCLFTLSYFDTCILITSNFCDGLIILQKLTTLT